MQPKYYKCVFTDPQPLNPETACVAENICSGKIVSYEIDWEDSRSLHNWVEKLDLVCCPSWKVGMMGSTVFVGWVITMAWMPRLSDMYSRKIFLQIGMITNFAMFICMYYVTSVEWMIAITFVFGLVMTIRVNIAFVYMMELLPNRLKNFYAVLCSIMDTTGIIYCALYFWFIGKNSTHLFLIGFAIQLFCTVSVQFLPESPRLLVELGRLDEAGVAFQKIAKMNGQDFDWNTRKTEFKRPIVLKNQS